MNPACPRIALMPSSFSIVITSHSSSIPSPRLRAHCAATLAAVRQGDHAWVSANSGADYILRTYSGHTCTSCAGELDFAVERLIRDAKQRAKGHAEAEAIGGDRRRLHIERDCARLR